MTKTFLLAATALTALVATSAQAQANLAISNTDLTVNNAIESANFTLASELNFTTPIDRFIELTLTPSASAVLPTGNALLTISFSAADEDFGTDVTAAAIIQGDGVTAGRLCVPTRTVAADGDELQNTVTFLLSSLSGCNNANPILIRIPVEIDDENTITVNSNFRTEAGTPIDGGTDSVAGLLFDSAFDVDVVDNSANVDVVADVEADPVYTDFTVAGPYELGSVTVDVDTAIAKTVPSLGTAATFVAATDIDDLTVTVTADTGSFEGLDIAIDGSDIDVEAENYDTATSAAITPITDPDTITIDVSENNDVGETDVISGGTFSASVLVDLGTGFSNFTVSGDIAPVTLGGTNFVAPWLAINSSANTSTVRVSNGGDATGPVILTLLSPNDGSAVQTCDSGDLAELGSVPANGRIEIDVNDLRACFGTVVLNGDVRFTIQGGAEELTAKARLRSTTGVVVETSLGRLGETGDSY